MMMKKVLFALVMMLGMATVAQAQVNAHAIGIRSGSGNFGYGGELSYQHGMGEANRLEFDLGWRGQNINGSRYSFLGISGIYHWVWNITAGLNWYIGPGAQLGFFRDNNDIGGDGVTLAIGGQIGLEYDLNTEGIPLLVSLDTRPMWGFFDGYGNGFGYGLALGLRYTF